MLDRHDRLILYHHDDGGEGEEIPFFNDEVISNDPKVVGYFEILTD